MKEIGQKYVMEKGINRVEQGRSVWMVHIVVPPKVLQIPSAPSVFSLAPPMGTL